MVYNIINKRNRTGSPEKEDKEMLEIREEEMNMVTGGNLLETAEDSHCLYTKRCMNEEYNVVDLMFDWNELSKRVDEGWLNAGIISVTSPFKDNKYLRNGKEITRKEALHSIGY